MPLTIPPIGSVSTPPPSPLLSLGQNIGGVVGGAIAALFPPNPSITGLPTSPPPAQTQLFPAGTAGAAFTSNPTIPPTADELAAQALANLQVAAEANQPDPSLVINTSVLGRTPKETEGVEKAIQEGLQTIYLLNKKSKTENLNEKEISELKNLTKMTNAFYRNKTAEKRKIDEEAARISAEPAETAGAGAGAGTAGAAGAGAADKKPKSGKKAKKK
jgi:hypothetical protein